MIKVDWQLYQGIITRFLVYYGKKIQVIVNAV